MSPCKQSHFFTFFNQGRENDALPKSQQAFEDATVQTFGPVNFVSLNKHFFFSSSIRLLINRLSFVVIKLQFKDYNN